MQIGEPLRIIVVEPLECPVDQPAVQPGTEPNRAPEPNLDQVPVAS